MQSEFVGRNSMGDLDVVDGNHPKLSKGGSPRTIHFWSPVHFQEYVRVRCSLDISKDIPNEEDSSLGSDSAMDGVCWIAYSEGNLGDIFEKEKKHRLFEKHA